MSENQDYDVLQRRLEVIEGRLAKLEGPMDDEENKVAFKRKSLKPSATEKPNAFFEWLKRDTLMKLGAFLLLLAMGWFVSYTFTNNWIGPVGRISLGLITGALIMLFGNLQISKRSEVGQVLVTTGGSMMLLTLYAARIVYDFFTPASVLGLMALIVVSMAVIAVVHKKPAVAFMALLGGAVAPLLTHSGTPDHIALFSYIFLLNIGVLITVALRGWRDLITLAILITGAYSFLFHNLSDATIWLFMGLFFVQFFGSITSAILHSKKALTSDILATGLNGLLFLWWTVEFVPEEWSSLILSALVLILLGISFAFFKIGSLRGPLYINAALGILFLSVATAIELDGAVLTIAFSIEALALVVLTAFLLKENDTTNKVSLLQILPFVLSFQSMSKYDWKVDSLLNENFFALLVVMISIGLTAFLLRSLESKQDSLKNASLHAVLATVVGVALVWRSSHLLIESENIARGVSLVVYTILGVSSLFQGTRLENKNMRIYGGALLSLVILRLLFVEVWDMTLVSRIVTFVSIGVLLITTAFFQKKHISN